MKKLFALVMMMTALTASAQYEPGTFSVQPRLGATGAMLSNMPDIMVDVLSFNEKADAQATGGYFIGADAEYQFNKWLSLSAGLDWAQAGSGWKDLNKTKDNITLEMKDMKIETSYLNVPLTANFYVWKGLALHTGVQFGFLTSAKMKAKLLASSTQDGVNFNQTNEFDKSCKDGIEKLDISIPAGLSYEFKNHLVIDARYNIGLTKVNKNADPGEKDCRNQVFVLTLGYKIKL